MNRRLIKGIALFILLWTALDLGVPGFCRTDGVIFPPVSSHHGVVWDKPAAAQQPAPAADEDHCFCCCSHIIHSPWFALEPGSQVAFVDLLDFLPQPDSIASPLFHPPRV